MGNSKKTSTLYLRCIECGYFRISFFVGSKYETPLVVFEKYTFSDRWAYLFYLRNSSIKTFVCVFDAIVIGLRICVIKERYESKREKNVSNNRCLSILLLLWRYIAVSFRKRDSGAGVFPSVFHLGTRAKKNNNILFFCEVLTTVLLSQPMSAEHIKLCRPRDENKWIKNKNIQLRFQWWVFVFIPVNIFILNTVPTWKQYFFIDLKNRKLYNGYI